MGIYSTRIDLTGKRFGRLVVIGLGEIRRKKVLYWNCLCDCGNKKSIAGGSLKNGESKSCGCLRSEMVSDQFWSGFEEISGGYFSSIVHGAKKRNFEFNITIEQIWELFIKQERKCALSGDEIFFAKNSYDRNNQTASLDRIDSSKGYIEGNLQWVHKQVNFMKQELEDSVLIEWCKKIYEHSKNNQLVVKTNDCNTVAIIDGSGA